MELFAARTAQKKKECMGKRMASMLLSHEVHVCMYHAMALDSHTALPTWSPSRQIGCSRWGKARHVPCFSCARFQKQCEMRKQSCKLFDIPRCRARQFLSFSEKSKQGEIISRDWCGENKSWPMGQMHAEKSMVSGCRVLWLKCFVNASQNSCWGCLVTVRISLVILVF